MSLSDRRWLTVLGACPVAWARRFGITPFAHACSRCGVSRETSVPFACGIFRGLVAPTCSCGCERGPYAVVRADGREIAPALGGW